MHAAKVVTTLVIALALAVVGAGGTSHAETVNCTPITSVPAVITVSGIYCLTGDLNTAMTSGSAIQVNVNNVVLDLNGFKLGGLAAGPGTFANGIYALNRQNITIKNGTVRGFFYGIFFEDSGGSQGHVIEDIRADRNTLAAMNVGGSGNIIRNNQLVATGGTMTSGANADAIGLWIFGTGPRVLDNDVINTVKQGTGIAYGIVFGSGVTDGLAVSNRITEADLGIFYNGSSGKYRDNVTFDVGTPFGGTGTDVGNNS